MIVTMDSKKNRLFSEGYVCRVNLPLNFVGIESTALNRVIFSADELREQVTLEDSREVFGSYHHRRLLADEVLQIADAIGQYIPRGMFFYFADVSKGYTFYRGDCEPVRVWLETTTNNRNKRIATKG